MTNNNSSTGNPIIKVYRFYRNGFRSLSSTGRTLWLIIGLKLLIMFALLKPFFFPNHNKRQAVEQQKTNSEIVQQELINRGQ